PSRIDPQVAMAGAPGRQHEHGASPAALLEFEMKLFVEVSEHQDLVPPRDPASGVCLALRQRETAPEIQVRAGESLLQSVGYAETGRGRQQAEGGEEQPVLGESAPRQVLAV